jgi:uncharacterized membrane protein
VSLLVILFFFGLATAIVGRWKGSSFFIWFLVGFCLPLLGLIAAFAYRVEKFEPERRCPRCGAVHKLYVQVCRVCGEDMYLPDPREVRHPNVG